MSARYRSWLIELKDCTERIHIKPPKTEQEIRDLFNVPATAKVKPILDKRMKKGGKLDDGNNRF